MGSSCLLSSHPWRILVQQAKRTRSDLSWGLHPLVSHGFSESQNRLFLSLEDRVRLYAKALASIKLDSGRLNTGTTERWARAFGFTGASEPPSLRAPAAWRAFPQEAGAQQIPLC